MEIPSELVEAYRQTSYWVETPGACHRLKVGALHPAFERLLCELGILEWSYLTASNPRSRVCAPAENSRRNSQLREMLRECGHDVWPGRGVGTDPRWEPEASWCVLGLPRAEALTVAAAFDQHAFVAGRRGEPAELVFTAAAP